MSLIPGITTPKKVVIGEELDGDYFELVAGQYRTKAAPVSNDFFRSTNGTALPDGVADYTEAITHNGFLGLGLTTNPQSPLDFGEPFRNDVIRLYSAPGSGDHNFFGFGINSGILRYQVNGSASAHIFAGSTSPTTSQQYMRSDWYQLTVGDPSKPVGNGNMQIGMESDNGYVRFATPTTAADANSGAIQADIFFDGISGTGDKSGASIVLRTHGRNDTANAFVQNRFVVYDTGEVAVLNLASPWAPTDVAPYAATMAVAGSLRLKGGVIAPGLGKQAGGIVFGAGPAGILSESWAECGGADDGITSIVPGNITFYSAGLVGGELNSGGVWSKPGGGSWVATSDQRVKTSIESVEPKLDKLMALRPVTYQYNGEGGTAADKVTRMGFLAQDVQKIFPEWVSESSNRIKDSPVLQLDSSALVYELLLVVQQQQQQINQLLAK